MTGRAPGGGSPRVKLVMPRWIKRLTGTFLPKVAQRAMRDTRDFVLEQARVNVGSKGPRFLRVRTGRLLRSLRTDLREQGGGSVLTLRAARHGWFLEHRRRNPIPWATDALSRARLGYPRFLGQALRREMRNQS